jgi:hypothetical protein
MLTALGEYPAVTEYRNSVLGYLLEPEDVKSMIIVQEKVRDHFKVDEGVRDSSSKIIGCFLDVRMNQIVQESMHSMIVKILSSIRVEDEEHVNLMRMRMNGIECFRHLCQKVRMVLIVGRKIQGSPVISVLGNEKLRTLDVLKSSSSSHCLSSSPSTTCRRH